LIGQATQKRDGFIVRREFLRPGIDLFEKFLITGYEGRLEAQIGERVAGEVKLGKNMESWALKGRLERLTDGREISNGVMGLMEVYLHA
jgi:hypothetical protein